MDRPPVAITTSRIVLTSTLVAVLINIFDLAVRFLRPDIIQGRPQDLQDMGRTIRESYDFIVIGAGSAGSVVASRLSEIQNWNVLLLEAGGPEPTLSDIPFVFANYQRPPTAWETFAEPTEEYCQAMDGNRCLMQSGKVLGGTSTINAMLYVRGNKRDYDHWAELGNDGWDYETVLEYFKKSEDIRLERLKTDTVYHSTGGYLTVDDPVHRNPLADIFLQAGQELGYDIIDHNGETQTGFTRMYYTVRNGFRCSAAKAFLQPAKDRTNLDISLNSEVERIIIDPNTRKATGVEFNKAGRKYTVTAGKEVTVSAGAIYSPKLLMLSGVGPKDHLQEIGISPIIADLKVGDNLQDHIGIGGMVYVINQPLGNTVPRILTVETLLEFMQNSRGSLMTAFAETVAFINTKYSDDPEWPDAGIYFNAVPENADGGSFTKNLVGMSDKFFNAVYEPILYRDSYAALGTVMRPKSRGLVRLRSRDPKLPPTVFANYLSDERDVKVAVEAAKFVLSVSITKTMKTINATINPNPFPGCEQFELMSDEYLECAVRQYTATLWHYAGTCKMGPDTDPDAVVDPRLRVRGIDGLRVADASIFPQITTANTNAPVIMVAEKASDMIKEDWGELLK